MSTMFLDDSELDELTGIMRGATTHGVKKTKYQLQAAFLRANGVAFIANARGKPIVLRSALEGRRRDEAPKQKWQPSVVGA